MNNKTTPKSDSSNNNATPNPKTSPPKNKNHKKNFFVKQILKMPILLYPTKKANQKPNIIHTIIL